MKQVLFWSKYSANSKKIINLMNQYNAKIESICIDNEEVRKRIAKDEKIGISVVPTILALYQNGVIEKYEGEKAFELLYAAFPMKPFWYKAKIVGTTDIPIFSSFAILFLTSSLSIHIDSIFALY
jgi:hypothetical protein